MESAEQAGLRYKQAVKLLYQYQLRIEQEKQHNLNSDDTAFNPDEHLIFSPPSNTWTLADMELEYENPMTPFALSGDFPLFSADAIGEMRSELLSFTVRDKFHKSNSIVSYQLRGMVPEYVSHPKNRNETDKNDWKVCQVYIQCLE